MRLLPPIALLAAVTALIAPASARADQGTVATLAQPAPSDRMIVKDLMWRCQGHVCRAAESGSRPITVCQALARRLGPVAALTVNGKALGDAELEACNRRVAQASQ